MIKNCKMKVTTSQFREIQKILFKKQIYWDYETNSKTKTSDYLYIKKNTISWETLELKNNNYVEINANDFIRDNTTFPIHKIEKDGLYVVEFTDVNTARVVWVKSVLENNKTLKVGTTSDGWDNFYIDCWKDISKKDVMDFTLKFNEIKTLEIYFYKDNYSARVLISAESFGHYEWDTEEYRTLSMNVRNSYKRSLTEALMSLENEYVKEMGIYFNYYMSRIESFLKNIDEEIHR